MNNKKIRNDLKDDAISFISSLITVGRLILENKYNKDI